jgi:hypothetical protein
MNTTLVSCPPKSGLEGTPDTADLGGAALQSGDYVHGGQAAFTKTSPDGMTFAGSATAVGSDPGETSSWSWSFKASA